MRFLVLVLGWRPMSALARLDASVWLPYSAALLHSVVRGASFDHSSNEVVDVELDIVVVYPMEVGEDLSEDVPPC